MTCPWCSYENLSRAKFCGDCGRGLQADAVCDSCSTPNPAGHRFCDSCGTPLAESGPLPATLTPPLSAAPAPMPRTQWISSASDGLAQARARLEAVGLYGWETAALIAIVIVALALRLVSLTDIPPNVLPDEADNLQVVYRIMAGSGPGFFGLDWAQSPAFSMYLVSWFMQVFGETIAGMRMANVVLSTLSLPVFYFVARQNDIKQAGRTGGHASAGDQPVVPAFFPNGLVQHPRRACMPCWPSWRPPRRSDGEASPCTRRQGCSRPSACTATRAAA